MTRQTQPADDRRCLPVKYTTQTGKVYNYSIPERFMGYALLSRFDGNVLAFMAWWHDQAQMEKAFKRQRAARRRSARRGAATRAHNKARGAK